MLAQRRRRWANISSALSQRVVFAGLGPVMTNVEIVSRSYLYIILRSLDTYVLVPRAPNMLTLSMTHIIIYGLGGGVIAIIANYVSYVLPMVF